MFPLGMIVRVHYQGIDSASSPCVPGLFIYVARAICCKGQTRRDSKAAIPAIPPWDSIASHICKDVNIGR